MRCYFAAGGSLLRHAETVRASGVRNRLLSFAGGGVLERLAEWLALVPHARVFMDCGAYSVRSGTATVDLSDYCEFLHRFRGNLSDYAALDVIGDEAATLANWRAMRRAGLDGAIPTLHPQASLDVLREFLREGARTVALGGGAAAAWTGGLKDAAAQRARFDAVFRELERWWPVRVHVFGCLQQWVLERYPVASVDSTTAAIGASFGVVQEFRRGRFLNDKPYMWGRRGADTPFPEAAGREPQHERARFAVNAQAVLRLERYVTDLWAERGVTWSMA